jgi:hypothetical protein
MSDVYEYYIYTCVLILILLLSLPLLFNNVQGIYCKRPRRSSALLEEDCEPSKRACMITLFMQNQNLRTRMFYEDQARNREREMQQEFEIQNFVNNMF